MKCTPCELLLFILGVFVSPALVWFYKAIFLTSQRKVRRLLLDADIQGLSEPEISQKSGYKERRVKRVVLALRDKNLAYYANFRWYAAGHGGAGGTDVSRLSSRWS